MRLGTLALALAMAVASASWSAAPPARWRNLNAEEQKEVTTILRRMYRHEGAGEFEQSAKLAKQIAAFRSLRQGSAHWQAVDAQYEADKMRGLSAVPVKDRPAVIRARGLNDEGVIHLNQGRLRDAEKAMRQALLVRKKALGEAHPVTAGSYLNVAACLQHLGRHAEALPLYRKAVEICQNALGESHPVTAIGHNGVASCLNAQGKAAEALPLYQKALLIREKALGEGHPDTARSYGSVAACLQDLGRHAEALPLYRKALAINEKAKGEGHPDTASGYNNLALCLHGLGKHSEAHQLFRKALGIRLKTLGEGHPSTATSYSNVAACMDALGKAAEALPLHRKALEIKRKALGEGHPETAIGYNNLASCLDDQGRYAEALPLFKKALEINQKVNGEGHPDTANSYSNLASCLLAQGKAAEGLPLHHKALEITRKVLGEGHPDTARKYDNAGRCLLELDKAPLALPLFRTGLAIREKALEEGHPDRAISYNNVAYCLGALGKHAEALPLYRKALAITEKALGPDHPFTATFYNNVARCLSAQQGKAAEAPPLFRKALEIQRKGLGESHPNTAVCSNNLACFLWHQGTRNEAVRLWQSSLRGQEAARALRADSGFDRAQQNRGVSPRAALAVALAQLKQPRNAFAHAEASLARGLLDDLSGYSPAESARAWGLRARLAKLEPTLTSVSASARLSDEHKARYEAARREYGQLWREWSDLHASASERAVLPLELIQKAIPRDAALVLWVEELKERWGCVVRREGAPAWERVGDTGEGTVADLYKSLTDPASDARERREGLAALGEQQLAPLLRHLKGARHLFVVPTGPMALIPAELIAEGFSVSYIPSGSMLGRVVARHRALDGSTLLALGDPAFDRAPPPEPPQAGALVLSVLPGSNAAKAGLQAGDVILSVGSVAVDSPDDLKAALAELPAPVTYWREGQKLRGKLPATPLGATVDPRSARAAVRAWRGGQVAVRGTGHKRLPGTRLEVRAISALVEGGTALLGDDASEQKLDGLIDAGKLRGYRLLHLATHGEPDNQRPGNSALILAQSRLPDPAAQVNAGKHPYAGRLTVERILGRWDLDCDLVVLSACETGLGKRAKGDGLLGFAQAFLGKGARAVVLSRWKVDDAATSLLMVRFYENLLGKRKGLDKPMGRAASLDEAKRWLRALPREQAERLATLHSGGALRGSEADQKPPARAKAVELKGDRPYSHPFYWAAFTLLGDPD